MKRLALIALLFIAPLAAGQFGGERSIVAGPVHDGQELTADLPPQEQFLNIGSRLDGAGMCVFTAIEMAARAQGLEEMRGFRDWCAARYPGGGWPEKVDRLLAAYGKAVLEPKGLRVPDYYQYEGRDPEQVLRRIDASGRPACITYGQDERYIEPGNPQGIIAHMVTALGYRKHAAVLDNNFVASRKGDGWDENVYVWLTPAELVRRGRVGRNGQMWIFVWLPPAAPPSPRNIAPIKA